MKLSSPFFRRILAFGLVAVMLLADLSGGVVANEDVDAGTFCGLSAHSHVADVCFTQTSNLICSEDNSGYHIHGDDCWTESETLICEDPDHEHEAACWQTGKTLTCQIPEKEWHEHTDSCRSIVITQTCTLEEHTHNEGCYVDPNDDAASQEPTGEGVVETTAPATEPTEPATEPSVPVTEPPKPEGPVCANAEGCTEEAHGKDCPLYVPTLAEKLLAAQTLGEFHALLTENAEASNVLTLAELTALAKYADNLHAALETPTQEEDHYHGQICAKLEQLMEKFKTKDPEVKPSEPKADPTVPATEPPKPEEPVCSNAEGCTEDTHGAECPLYVAPACTCDPAPAEGKPHGRECPLYVPTLAEKLLAAQTLQEFHDLLTENAEAANTLTAEALTVLTNYAGALHAALEEPTQDEEACFGQISEKLEALAQTLEPTAPEVTFFQQLMDSQSAEQMYLLVLEDMQNNAAVQLTALTEEELTALIDHALLFPKDPEGVSDRADLLDTLAQLSGQDIIGDAEILLPEGYSDLNAHCANPSSFVDAGHAIGAGNYILTADLTLERGSLIVPNNHTVVIDLNGFVLTGNGSSSVIITRGGTGSTLTIKDSSAAKTGGITGGVAGSGGGIYAFVPVIIDGGNIYGNTAANYGGGIYCEQTLTINGGKIYGNSAANGGGVYATNLVMNSGVIGDDTATITWSDGTTTRYPQIPSAKPYIRINGITAPNKNTASGSGGGVYCSKLTLNGGAVVGNYASSHGGGIYSSNNSEIKNQSIIYGNEAGSHGGGFRLSSGTTAIENSTLACNIAHNYGGGIDTLGSVNLNSGADIIYNTADSNGGGITVEGPGYCKVEGGRISYNYANSSGGGFRCVGTLDLIKGEVNYNRGNNGGGISARTDKPREEGGSRIATVSLEGGAISHNAATFSGGGIHIEIHNTDKEITVKADGTEISYNTAGSSGGGIYASAQKGTMYVDLSNGTLSNNTAQHGGGICMSVGANVGGGITVSGTDVSENTASAAGGGVYLAGGTFTLNGDTAVIQKNTAVNGGGVYLTGGQPNLLHGAMLNNEASGDGGGIYINQQNVKLAPTGDVAVTGNKAGRGAGIFIGGTNGTNASFSADKNAAGKIEITENIATGEGGGVCISNGYFDLDADNITLQRNKAASGGAVAVLSGNFTMSGGTIGGESNGNTAHDGGAVYVNGGNVALSDGEILSNTAERNGGGITVNNGKVIMSGGSVSGNKATSGEGGGMFVSSSGGQAVSVMVYSGTLSGNSAAKTGGAVAVEGGASSTITVQIGVNHDHYPGGSLSLGFTHDGSYVHNYCPEITGNTSSASGGAFYITGGSTTQLNMYCLTTSGNATSSDQDINNVVLSNFMMVEGGQVIISSADEHNQGSGFGNAAVNGSIHIVGGTLDLYGSMQNPSFAELITVDLTSADHHFLDHRTNDGFIKLRYDENFTLGGIIDKTQTVLDLANKESYVISNNLYVHSGYRIVEWNTMPDGSGTKYIPGTEYVFALTEADAAGAANAIVTSEMVLYAIWEANGYSVSFDPNVPKGETYSGTPMENQSFNYGIEGTLNTNTYIRPGYQFGGWDYMKDDGSAGHLDDGALVWNLTQIPGNIIPLKAVWTVCTHPENKISYTAEGHVLTKTCTLCHKTGTVTLTAEDATYDGNPHPASAVYLDSAWLNPAVNYTGTKIGDDTAPVVAPETVTNAGNYTASVSEGGQTVSVSFVIHKAEQDPPAGKPGYTEPPEGSDTLTIIPIAGLTESPSTKSPIEYFVWYYNTDDERVEVPATVSADAITATLPAGLKNYYVCARFAETDNYLASPETKADTTYFFYGDVKVNITADEGIEYTLDGGDSGLHIYATLMDGYYLHTADGTFTITKTGDANNALTIASQSEQGHFLVTCKPDVSEDVTATLAIGSARKTPSITGAVEEGQVFGTVDGQNVTISHDSAYTVYFEAENYDTADYEQPALTFSQALPAGTKIILLDKQNGSYWSFETASNFTTAPLGSFIRMGGSDAYAAANGDLKLLAVVDFSRAGGSYLSGTLTTTLTVAKKSGSPAPELDSGNAVSVTLGSSGYALGAPAQSGLKNTLSCSGPGISASRWDHREMALVVTPVGTDLPSDAVLSATMGTRLSDCDKLPNGSFIVPLGSYTGSFTLELKSGMFPDGVKSYQMKAELFASESVAEKAPMNGHKLGAQTLTFTSTQTEMAVHITEASNKRLYQKGETITVDVATANVSGMYDLVVQLQQKDQSGSYVDTLYQYANPSAGRYAFTLTGMAAGSYRIHAMIVRDDGYTVLHTSYFFIVQ